MRYFTYPAGFTQFSVSRCPCLQSFGGVGYFRYRAHMCKPALVAEGLGGSCRVVGPC